jgi:EAL domain-containing protein (putative c-di-GMP-specific phosphodiesterase class I)
VLDALKLMSIIDDFGTGYLSLSYLERFPINTLKIDGIFFVQNVTTDVDDATIVSAVIGMGNI